MLDQTGVSIAVTPLHVEAFEIKTKGFGLDGIQVLFSDLALGQGRVTITCYGCAWTAYFGGMGPHTIRQFFAGCDTGYLVTKLGITPYLKSSKRHDVYLGRIIDAIKATLANWVAASA